MNNQNIISFPLLILVFFNAVISYNRDKITVDLSSPKDAYEYVAHDTKWITFTKREKIGQTMIMVCQEYRFKEFKGGNLDTFFQRYPVSRFFLPEWYYRHYTP